MTVNSADLITYGRTFLGRPYVFGAAGPSSFDCSGLMQYLFKHFGISLPRVTGDQVKVGSNVEKGSQRPGDLVFSSWDGRPNSHVGMYVGNDQILVAPHTGDVVKIQALNSNYMNHVSAIRRVPGVDGSTEGTTSLIPPSGDAGSSGFLGRIADALSGIGSSIASVGKVSEWILRLSIPNVAVRFISGILGMALLILGLIYIGREAR